MEMNLKEYLRYTKNEENLQKLFYNMSKTMKYIHSYDYYISNPDVSDVLIKNVEKLSPIQYKNLKKVPFDDNGDLINRDIHNLAILQVAAYTDLIDYVKPGDPRYEQFLKDSYDEYKSLIPEDDERYMDGMINRDSVVYYSDYVDRRNELELEKLQKEVNGGKDMEGGFSHGIQKVKSTSVGSAYADTDKETRDLYSNIMENRQAAFTNFLILPITMILLGIISSLIIFFFS